MSKNENKIDSASKLATDGIADGIREMFVNYVEADMLVDPSVTVTSYPHGDERDASIELAMTVLTENGVEDSELDAIDISYAELGVETPEDEYPCMPGSPLAADIVGGAARGLQDYLRKNVYEGVVVVVTDYTYDSGSRVGKIEVQGDFAALAEAESLPTRINIIRVKA